jgi:Protein of unknown function (DUF2637)
MLRFSDLNPLGRAIIIAVAFLTLAVAAMAFATSYGALYAFIRDTGLYSDRLARLWPLLLDTAFIVAQLAAILGGIFREPRGWPILTMVLTGALTVWFNLQHAGADPGRRLAATIPPVLMILAFETDIAIVKWVMRALGRPLETAEPSTHLLNPGAQSRSAPRFAVGQSGHERGSGGEAGGTATTKREAVQAYLDRLGSSAGILTAREIKEDLAEEGVNVSEQYVGRVMSGALGGRNGHGKQ